MAVLDFPVNPVDPMEHGRTTHARALEGEFGVVTPYEAPSAQEASDKQKNIRMQNAISQVQHYEMLGNTDMISQWKAYYADVYNGVIDPVEPAE